MYGIWFCRGNPNKEGSGSQCTLMKIKLPQNETTQQKREISTLLVDNDILYITLDKRNSKLNKSQYCYRWPYVMTNITD